MRGRAELNLAIACPKCGVGAGKPCVNQRGGVASRSHVLRRLPAPCGTHGGYVRHVKAGEQPCDQCREGRRRYMAEYRKRNPESRERDIDLLHARREAVKRLIAMHRADFDALMDEMRPQSPTPSPPHR